MSDDANAQPADDAAKKDEGAGGETKGGEAKTPLFRRPLFWVILIVVLAAVIIGGTLYYLNARQYETTDDAFVDAHIVRLAPEVAGTLIQVADIDNRHVEAGRLLAVIKPSGPEAQLAEANAGVDQAQAQLQQSQAQIGAAIATSQQAAAQAQGPIASANKAALDLARYEALAKLDRSAVSSIQLDQARATARSTAAEAAAAKRQVDTANAQVAVARKQADASAAMVLGKRAQVDQAKVTVGNLRLVAPVSGQVVNRSVNLGSYVAPGTQLMAIIPDTMWITANFKETQLQLMRVGQPVAIKVDAYPNVEFKGRVDSIQRGAGQAFAILPPQNATGNYVKVVQRVPVRITFVGGKDQPDPRNYPIGPGMSVIPTVKVR
jgi:membrane fusion protein (multidrug efflux system)